MQISVQTSKALAFHLKGTRALSRPRPGGLNTSGLYEYLTFSEGAGSDILLWHLPSIKLTYFISNNLIYWFLLTCLKTKWTPQPSSNSANKVTTQKHFIAVTSFSLISRSIRKREEGGEGAVMACTPQCDSGLVIYSLWWVCPAGNLSPELPLILASGGTEWGPSP